MGLIYDMEKQEWVRLNDYEVKEETPFLDSSLVNDHLDAIEIVRLNRSALEIDELKSAVENEMKVSFNIPMKS